MNIIILDPKTTIDECSKLINAFEKKGYETFYSFKSGYLMTRAPERMIKKISKKFSCIQSYNIIK